MQRPFPRRRVGLLVAAAAIGCLGFGSPMTTGATGTTAATYTSTVDAGGASFTTRTACSTATAYPSTVTGLNPSIYYRFGEAAAPQPTTVADSSGNGNTGVVVAGAPTSLSENFGAGPAIWCDTTGGMGQPLVDRTSTTAGFVVWPSLRTQPNVFTLMAWIQVPNGLPTGGKIMGFGDSMAGLSTRYDRHLFVDDAGRVWFGIHPGGFSTITSPGTVNDGKPHQVVASLGPAGGRLYVDGVLVASNAGWTVAEAYNGYWRIGWDNLGGWAGGADPTNFGLGGVIDEAAVFEGTQLTPAQVASTYADNHW